jgi:hypothetical protein
MKCQCLISRKKHRSRAARLPSVGKTIVPSECHSKPGTERRKKIPGGLTTCSSADKAAFAGTLQGGIGALPLCRSLPPRRGSQSMSQSRNGLASKGIFASKSHPGHLACETRSRRSEPKNATMKSMARIVWARRRHANCPFRSSTTDYTTGTMVSSLCRPVILSSKLK